MRATEILGEDGYFTDKLKKAGLGFASKFSSKAQGALNARRRATELMTSYKEALGGGLQPTALDLRKWLASGNNPVDASMMKDAAKRSGMNLRTNTEIKINQVRDFLVALSGAEARMGQQGGAGVGRAAQPTPTGSGQPGGPPSGDEPLTVKTLGPALAALKKNDGRFV